VIIVNLIGEIRDLILM